MNICSWFVSTTVTNASAVPRVTSFDRVRTPIGQAIKCPRFTLLVARKGNSTRAAIAQSLLSKLHNCVSDTLLSQPIQAYIAMHCPVTYGAGASLIANKSKSQESLSHCSLESRKSLPEHCT